MAPLQVQHELAALGGGFHPDRLEEVLETRSAMLQVRGSLSGCDIAVVSTSMPTYKNMCKQSSYHAPFLDHNMSHYFSCSRCAIFRPSDGVR